MKYLISFLIFLFISCSSPKQLTTGEIYYYTLEQLDSILIPDLHILNYIEMKGAETNKVYKRYFYIQGDSVLYNIELINDSIYETNKIKL